MATSSIETGNRGQGRFHGTARTLTSISRAVALATVLVAGIGTAQAADSTDRITPPNPADVAILRGLLALQHPALCQTAQPTSASPTAVVPAVTTEPTQQGSNTPAQTEGEACTSPVCGVEAETHSTATGKLGDAFRASLERSMAAAGFSADRL